MSALVDQAEAAMQQGRFADAKVALQQALARDLDARLAVEARSMLGLSMVALGEATAALEHLRAAVAAEPGEAMFRYNLGRGLDAVGDVAGALKEHGEAVRLAPGMAALEVALAQVQMKAGQFADARAVLEKYTGTPQVQPGLLRMLVQAQVGAGDTHAALDTARRLLPDDLTSTDAQGRADAMTAAGLAHAAMDYAEAKRITQALVTLDAGDAEAATVLSQLTLWTDGPEAAGEVLNAARAAGALSPRILVDALSLNDDAKLAAEAEAMAARTDLAVHDRADLLVALAQHADRTGDAVKAWDLAAQGKALEPKGEPRDWRATLETQLAIYRDSAPVEVAPNATQHLYLLGVPRSGQSLVQSVLAASPDIVSAGERGALLQHLLFRQDAIAAMGAGQRTNLFRDLAEADRRGLERLLGMPQWMVDKSPLHFAIAGSIARIHPSARFACLLRDPADVAVSIWLRRFPPVYDYANDFAAILDHLDIALDAIAAWQAEGVDIKVIDFADYVAEPARANAELFEWLGVDWGEGYLDPSSRTEPVPTYSAAQVRQPIGQGGSRGAGPFAEQLRPFAEKLDALRVKQAGLQE